MGRKSYAELLNQSRIIYRSLAPIAVQAMNNEKVHFTHAGFAHLLQRGKSLRSLEDRMRRLRLIPHIRSVLQSNESTIGSRIKFSASGQRIDYYKVESNINGKVVRVILTRGRSGQLEFLSVMSST